MLATFPNWKYYFTFIGSHFNKIPLLIVLYSNHEQCYTNMSCIFNGYLLDIGEPVPILFLPQNIISDIWTSVIKITSNILLVILWESN